MKVLVIGGAGFIGSHLTDALVKEGYRVVVVDDLSRGKEDNINKKADFKKLDIRSEKFENLLEKLKPRVVFHLAAQSSISKSLANPQDDIDINLMATQKILECIQRAQVKKIIFASSAAVYKQTNKLPIKEEFQKEPISFYGVSKLCSEYLLQNYYRRFGLPYVSLRFSNVYGKRQDSSAEGGVVAIFSQKILTGKTVFINGDGKQTRDLIYVSDVINACIAGMENSFIGEFNISTAKQTSILNLYKKILKIANTEENKKHRDSPYVEVKKSCLSYIKFNRLTGWKPMVGLDAGLLKTFNYFKHSR